MGKLIVIEGTDGSGKTTQTGRLLERLNETRPVRHLKFPCYEQESSALVRLYLGGAFGVNPEDVNAYAASSFYAVDRYASYKQDWGGYYEAGGLVLCDRYTTSNAIYQAEKLPDGERETFVNWLFDYEYRLLGLPRPDLVIYLDMPTEVTMRMMARRRRETGEAADIHERDENFLRRCRENVLQIADAQGWQVIGCAEGGEPRSIDRIHEDIWRAVSALLED